MKDQKGTSPLMLSVFHGNAELTQILIECGADIHLASEDANKTSILHMAAEYGHDDIA